MKKLISIICAFSFAAIPMFAEENAPTQEQPNNPEVQKAPKLPESFKKRILKQFDKDGDGYLNEEELAAAKASLKERRHRFEEMQKKHAERVLKEFDKDGDGKLSAEELVPLIEKQRRMFADMAERRGNPPRPHLKGAVLQTKGDVILPPPPPPNAEDGNTPPPPPPQEAKDGGSRPDKQGRPDRQMRRGDRPQFRHPMVEDLDELALPKKAE